MVQLRCAPVVPVLMVTKKFPETGQEDLTTADAITRHELVAFSINALFLFLIISFWFLIVFLRYYTR